MTLTTVSTTVLYCDTASWVGYGSAVRVSASYSIAPTYLHVPPLHEFMRTPLMSTLVLRQLRSQHPFDVRNHALYL